MKGVPGQCQHCRREEPEDRSRSHQEGRLCDVEGHYRDGNLEKMHRQDEVEKGLRASQGNRQRPAGMSERQKEAEGKSGLDGVHAHVGLSTEHLSRMTSALH